MWLLRCRNGFLFPDIFSTSTSPTSFFLLLLLHFILCSFLFFFFFCQLYFLAFTFSFSQITFFYSFFGFYFTFLVFPARWPSYSTFPVIFLAFFLFNFWIIFSQSRFYFDTLFFLLCLYISHFSSYVFSFLFLRLHQLPHLCF